MAPTPHARENDAVSRARAPRPPESVPLLVYRFAKDPLEFLIELRRHGDLVRIPLPRYPLYFIYSAELAEEVLVTRHHDYIKDRWTKGMSDAIGNGLLLSEGSFWKRQRRLAQPAFHHQRVAGYAAAMTAETAKIVAEWRHGSVRDVHADMTRLTSEIAAETLFGARVGEHARQVSDALDVVMQRFLGVANTGIPLPLAIPTPQNARFRRALAGLDEVLFGFIAERRKSDEDRGDLLSLLLAARDEDGEQMSDRQLRDECITLFVAGHETTALALTYALYLLAHDPDVDSRLAAELESVLGPREPGVDDVRRLPYTEAIIKESMRLYPPAWAIGREPIHDTRVGDWFVPAHAQIMIPQWALHRDPRYFDAPEEFRPERWLEPKMRDLPRSAYLPFGGGPRICIGNGFAMLEAVLALAIMARGHRFTATPDTKLRLMPSITLRPRRGVLLAIEERGRSY